MRGALCDLHHGRPLVMQGRAKLCREHDGADCSAVSVRQRARRDQAVEQAGTQTAADASRWRRRVACRTAQGAREHIVPSWFDSHHVRHGTACMCPYSHTADFHRDSFPTKRHAAAGAGREAPAQPAVPGASCPAVTGPGGRGGRAPRCSCPRRPGRAAGGWGCARPALRTRAPRATASGPSPRPPAARARAQYVHITRSACSQPEDHRAYTGSVRHLLPGA